MVNYMKAVFDTNILIDYLNGVEQAKQTILSYDGMISVITKIEVLVGTKEEERDAVLSFLKYFELIELNDDIAEKAVAIRQELRVKVPDAVIYATAQSKGTLLLTRNSKDFSPTRPDVHLPYSI